MRNGYEISVCFYYLIVLVANLTCRMRHPAPFNRKPNYFAHRGTHPGKSSPSFLLHTRRIAVPHSLAGRYHMYGFSDVKGVRPPISLSPSWFFFPSYFPQLKPIPPSAGKRLPPNSGHRCSMVNSIHSRTSSASVVFVSIRNESYVPVATKVSAGIYRLP